MPRSPFAATRAQLIDWLCERLMAGETLQQLSRRPETPYGQTPQWDTLMRWQRADPGLKTRFANARACGVGVRFQARHANRFCFPSADALALVERVRAGERLSDPALPAFTVVGRWRRRHPDFDAALSAHMAAAFRAQMAARAGPTPALTRKIGRRIAGGASLAALCAAPDMPRRHTLLRWRHDRPDFAAVIEDACDFRDWLLADRAEHLLDTALTPADLSEARALHRRRISRPHGSRRPARHIRQGA